MKRIEVDIAGTTLPIKVSEEEEVFVKKAIEDIHHKIKQYQSEFSRMDVHDCIRMAVLTYAVDHFKVQARMVDETSWNTLLDIRKQLQTLETQAIHQ